MIKTTIKISRYDKELVPWDTDKLNTWDFLTFLQQKGKVVETREYLEAESYSKVYILYWELSDNDQILFNLKYQDDLKKFEEQYDSSGIYTRT